MDYYDLGDDVAETLSFRYQNYQGEQMQWTTRLDHETIGNKVIKTEAGIVRPLTINDIHMSCLLQPGAVVERKVNCDSAFMLQNLPPVGAEIHQKMPWVPREQPIYLVMDNAGGHGTWQARVEYTRRLREDYNI
jgi:hypothetical protein